MKSNGSKFPYKFTIQGFEWGFTSQALGPPTLEEGPIELPLMQSSFSEISHHKIDSIQSDIDNDYITIFTIYRHIHFYRQIAFQDRSRLL